MHSPFRRGAWRASVVFVAALRQWLSTRAWAVRHTSRQLWKLPETRPLLLGCCICLTINFSELVFAGVKTCAMSSALYSADECGHSMLVLQILATVKVSLMVTVINLTCNARLATASSEQLGLTMSDKLARAMHRGWAAASSEEVFREVVQKVISSDAGLKYELQD
eukprot:scaffold103499_cov28-Prasinocladus_malaysianus.AAC.2